MRRINTVTTVDSDSINTNYVALPTITPTPVELTQQTYDPPTNILPSSVPVTITSGTLLSTLTNVTVKIPDIDIYTFYDNGLLPSIIATFVSEVNSSLNGVNYVEGDLVANYRTDSNNIFVDSDGNLIINSLDANGFSLDAESGSLIFTD